LYPLVPGRTGSWNGCHHWRVTDKPVQLDQSHGATRLLAIADVVEADPPRTTRRSGSRPSLGETRVFGEVEDRGTRSRSRPTGAAAVLEGAAGMLSANIQRLGALHGSIPNGSQGTQGGDLGLGQTLDARDIEPLIGPVMAQSAHMVA